MLAHHEGHAARAVVGARAVVDHAAAELREHEQHNVIAGLVIPQILHEGFNGVGHIGPQPGVVRGLVGVGVEAVVRGGGKQDAGAELGQMGLGDVLHVLPDGSGGVFHLRGVLVRRGGQDVGALQRVGAGAADVIQGVAGANGWTVHAAEDVQGLGALILALNAGEQTVGFEVAHRGYRHAFLSQGPGKPPAKVDSGQDVFGIGIYLFDNLTQPAFHAHLVGLTGVPDIHRAEVGVAGAGITDAQEYGQLAGVPESLQRSHGGVQAKLVVEGNDLIFSYAQRRPVISVKAAVIGDDGIQAVVAAGERQHCQNVILFGRDHEICLRLSLRVNCSGFTRTGIQKSPPASGTFLPTCGQIRLARHRCRGSSLPHAAREPAVPDECHR